MEREMKFFKIMARGGHVGAGHEAELVFYIKAGDVLSAINKVRHMPAVKHDKRNVITKVIIISEEEYNNGRKEKSAYDVYKKKVKK